MQIKKKGDLKFYYFKNLIKSKKYYIIYIYNFYSKLKDLYKI